MRPGPRPPRSRGGSAKTQRIPAYNYRLGSGDWPVGTDDPLPAETPVQAVGPAQRRVTRNGGTAISTQPSAFGTATPPSARGTRAGKARRPGPAPRPGLVTAAA